MTAIWNFHIHFNHIASTTITSTSNQTTSLATLTTTYVATFVTTFFSIFSIISKTTQNQTNQTHQILKNLRPKRMNTHLCVIPNQTKIPKQKPSLFDFSSGQSQITSHNQHQTSTQPTNDPYQYQDPSIRKHKNNTLWPVILTLMSLDIYPKPRFCANTISLPLQLPSISCCTFFAGTLQELEQSEFTILPSQLQPQSREKTPKEITIMWPFVF